MATLNKLGTFYYFHDNSSSIRDSTSSNTVLNTAIVFFVFFNGLDPYLLSIPPPAFIT